MAIFPIRTIGDPVLRLEAQPVSDFGDRTQKLIDDMIETMIEAPGAGLAAPQIGVSKALFVCDLRDDAGIRTFVNPKLTKSDGEWTFDEGCLSVQRLFFPIARAHSVHVDAFDRRGEPFSVEAEEYAAKILQHELDHLVGKLVLDRLDAETRREAMRTLRERALKDA
jgi:peptide deformylase